MNDLKKCADIFRERAHVELDTLIGCEEGICEEYRILGRIEALADMVRFLDGRSKSTS